ncbi:MAG: serine/threonine-protein phosphatase [Phycisphaeraceae bacterium]|nr:serine/threonine-protein phosphatase [Phycisphaerales bacterium]MCB9859678.1 serine/threonine-protein phosphatase [Phycisphaeraceae bacterium]
MATNEPKPSDEGNTPARVLTLAAYVTWVATCAPVVWTLIAHRDRINWVWFVVWLVAWLGFGTLVSTYQARTRVRVPTVSAIVYLALESVCALVVLIACMRTSHVDSGMSIAMNAALFVIVAGSLHGVLTMRQAVVWSIVQTMAMVVAMFLYDLRDLGVISGGIFFGFQLFAMMLGYMTYREQQGRRILAQTMKELEEAQDALRTEINEAADYVKSILPSPLHDAHRGLLIDYAFQASSQLGGDLLGYHFVDDEHLAVYLLDVQGHGVGASLLSVSAHNAIERNLLPNCDMRDPVSVLTSLNRAFPARSGGKFFSIVYAVINTQTGEVRYASAGHPPALLYAEKETSPLQLDSTGTLIGIDRRARFTERVCTIVPGGRLILFSDGAYEVRLANYQMLSIDGLVHVITDECRLETSTKHYDEQRTARSQSHIPLPQRVMQRIQTLAEDGHLLDDFSLVQIARAHTGE